MRTITKEDIGKKVTFKLKRCNWNPRKETRVIKNVLSDGAIIVVRHNGFSDFMVEENEIISLEGEE